MKALTPVALLALWLPSCAPIAAPGDFMRKVETLPATPPPGKSMVVFHRPRAYQGHPLYFGLWNEFERIAELGNGQSLAYVCEPGKHTFIGRSVEIKTVVDAELSPDEVYDMRTATGGWWIASFSLIPITKDDTANRARIEDWMKEHMFVEQEPSTDALRKSEATYKPKLEKILQEARASGGITPVTLGPGDHR